MEATIPTLLNAKDWSAVADRINRRFETDVSYSFVRDSIKKAWPNAKDAWADFWSDGTWLCWFKSRIVERFSLPASGSINEIRFTCELNVGFTQIEETEVMRQILRNEKPNSVPNEARSKLNPSNPCFVKPVNRLAALVAPEN